MKTLPSRDVTARRRSTFASILAAGALFVGGIAYSNATDTADAHGYSWQEVNRRYNGDCETTAFRNVDRTIDITHLVGTSAQAAQINFTVVRASGPGYLRVAEYRGANKYPDYGNVSYANFQPNSVGKVVADPTSVIVTLDSSERFSIRAGSTEWAVMCVDVLAYAN